MSPTLGEVICASKIEADSVAVKIDAMSFNLHIVVFCIWPFSPGDSRNYGDETTIICRLGTSRWSGESGECRGKIKAGFPN